MKTAIHFTLLDCSAKQGGFMQSYWFAHTQLNSDRRNTPVEINIVRVQEGSGYA